MVRFSMSKSEVTVERNGIRKKPDTEGNPSPSGNTRWDLGIYFWDNYNTQAKFFSIKYTTTHCTACCEMLFLTVYVMKIESK